MRPAMQKDTLAPVKIRDRDTGAIFTERVVAEGFLRWVYENRIGFRVYECLLNHRVVQWLYGKYQNSALTRGRILRFVDRHQIDLDEIAMPVSSYPSFNAFFCRTLKAGARRFDSDSAAVCSPADGKVLVHTRLSDTDRLPVKGGFVSVPNLLDSQHDAIRYQSGSAVVVRLAPSDYHRFHFPADGTASTTRNIKGSYHSVNPIALIRQPGIYAGNARAVATLETLGLGCIGFIEVGAMAVASIVQTYQPGPVVKGQEKGYFQFGGSTLVLLFEPGTIVFDEDLVADSARGVEVAVKAGSRLGVASKRLPIMNRPG